ncbi:MAG: tetratricopeptide repeat protein, partial [Phycisphaerae bacterium]
MLVALIAFATHAPSIGHGWVNWDDTTYIHNNALVNPEFAKATSQPVYSPWVGLWRMYTTLELPQYYPVTFHTYWNEYQLWGLRPTGYHAVNVILHAISAGLVVLLMRRLGMSDGAAAAVGLLFAVAAVQVMSVAWVSERKNVLSTNWALLTMLGWGRYCERGKAKWLVATLGFFAVTLLAKSAWLGLPIVLLAQAMLIHRTDARRAAVLLLMLPMSIASGWVTSVVERGFIDVDTPALGERLMLVPAAVLHYALRTVVPWDLTPFYPKWSIAPASPLFWIPLGLCLAGMAMWWTLRRRMSAIQHWGLALFFVSIGPVVGVLPFGNMSVTWVSDHFAYYAAIGLFAFLVAGARDFLRSRFGGGAVIVGATLCGGVALLNLIQTQRLIPIWKDSHALWGHVIARQPANALGYFGRGQAFLAQGDLQRAAEDYRRGLELRPTMSEFRLSRAAALAQMQRLDEATAEYEKTIELDPANRFAREQLAAIAFHQGVQLAGERKFDEAIAAYERAITLNGAYAPYWNNLGCVYLDQGKLETAVEKIGRAVQIDPLDAPAWNNLAIAQDQL